MEVVSFVNRLASRFDSHALYQRKRAVDWSRACVASDIGTVCEGFKGEISPEIGVVPVIDIIPVFHKELLSTFCLVLIVARKGERCIQVDLDVIHLFEKARCPEHRVY